MTTRRRFPRWASWLFFLVCPAALFVVPMFCRDQSARRALDAAIAARVARGEPIFRADFERPSIPDDQNAAPLIRRAASRINLSEDDSRTFDQFLIPSKADPAPIAAILDRHSAIFDDLAAARRRPDVVWGIRWKPNALDTDYAQLYDARQLSDFPLAAAYLDHRRNRHADALSHIETILFLARAIDHEGALTAYSVGIGLDARAAAATRALALTLDASTRDDIRCLIRSFLEEDARRAGIERLLFCERMTYCSTLQVVAERQFSSRHIFRRAAAASLDQSDRFRAAVLAPNRPAAIALLPRGPADPTTPVGKLLAVPIPVFQTTLDSQFRCLAERRVAATALALRLYALDHDSKLPPRLADLVPTYLPALPDDPFSATPRPLAYRAVPRPALASVSENGRDDQMDDTGAQGPSYYNPWASPDAVFFLDGENGGSSPNLSPSPGINKP